MKCKYGQNGACEKLFRPNCPDSSECYEFELYTNADRIRSMSDEELAVFLCAVKFRRETILNVPDFLYIKDAHDWLQQLYEGE